MYGKRIVVDEAGFYSFKGWHALFRQDVVVIEGRDQEGGSEKKIHC